MPTCKYCGEEIEFRHVGGQIIPIHPNGGWHCGTWSGEDAGGSGSSRLEVREFEESNEGFTRPTNCRECGARVFFVRHNGGSVWFDDLGWPWPKHGCFDKGRCDARIQGLRDVFTKSSPDALFGVVQFVRDHDVRQLRAIGVRWSNGLDELANVSGVGPIEPGQLIARSVTKEGAYFRIPGVTTLVVKESFDPSVLKRFSSKEKAGLACLSCHRLLPIKELPKHVLEAHLKEVTFRQFYEKITGRVFRGRKSLPDEALDEYKELRKTFHRMRR